MNEVSWLAYVERLFAEHEKAHGFQHTALTVAADELSRRLDELNHDHARALTDRAQFARVDIMNEVTKATDTTLRELGRAVSELQALTREHTQLPVHPGASKSIDDLELRMRTLETWRNSQGGEMKEHLDTRTLIFATVTVAIVTIDLVLAWVR